LYPSRFGAAATGAVERMASSQAARSDRAGSPQRTALRDRLPGRAPGRRDWPRLTPALPQATRGWPGGLYNIQCRLRDRLPPLGPQDVGSAHRGARDHAPLRVHREAGRRPVGRTRDGPSVTRAGRFWRLPPQLCARFGKS